MTAQASVEVHFIFHGKATSFMGFHKTCRSENIKEGPHCFIPVLYFIKAFSILDASVLLQVHISAHRTSMCLTQCYSEVNCLARSLSFKVLEMLHNV